MSAQTKTMRWQKLGCILKADPGTSWLATFTGPSFARVKDGSDIVTLYVTGRDDKNRSRIGIVEFDMSTMKPARVHAEPVLALGRTGTFDQNGTGYPSIVESDGKLWMFYVGWLPTVLVPFNNDIGLAVSDDGLHFSRVSEAPIVARSADDPLCMGSVSVMKDAALWRMWYTAFVSWGDTPDDPKHYYHIKYAESDNGIDWRRDNRVCVTYDGKEEYVLGKPSVIKHGGKYHMWYAWRGKAYKIGYAHSKDGINWTRRDDLVGIECSPSGFDAEAICYPHCFFFNGRLYMLYNGNDYGKSGLGLACLEDVEALNA